jgi:hypothetical protein
MPVPAGGWPLSGLLTATAPCNWDLVVPADVCPDWAGYPQTTKDTALWLASTYLWAATGRRFGPCPITVRPNQGGSGEVLYQDYPVTPGADGVGVPGGPFLFAGRWFNAGCATACCGDQGCAIVLRGPVAGIEEVTVDDEVIPASAYRVDITAGTWLLVRIDGQCWPVCQDFTADEGELGAFTVTYLLGEPVPEALAIATAMLACEWAKGLTGGVCALPSRMTQLSRQGVTVELDAPDAGEKTGIAHVDMVVALLNPSKRVSPPLLMSPDLPERCDRMTVIGAGS